MKTQKGLRTGSLALRIVFGLLVIGLTTCRPVQSDRGGKNEYCGPTHTPDVPVKVSLQKHDFVDPSIFIACSGDIVHWDPDPDVTDFSIQFDLSNDPDPFNDNKHGHYSKKDAKTGHAKKLNKGTYEYLEYRVTVTANGQTRSFPGDPGGIILQ